MPETVTETETVAVRWQYGRDGYDITDNPYAEQDAEEVRAWAGAHGDFCILEVTRRGDRWEPTGGDSSGWSDPEFADRLYDTPEAALASLIGQDWREAVCRCGDGTGEVCD